MESIHPMSASPSLDLHLRVRAAFVTQGSSLKRWCRENEVSYSNARDALIGRWNGVKGKAMRARVVQASGLKEAS